MIKNYGTKVLVLALVLVFSVSLIVTATEVDMEFKNAPLADVFQVLGDIAGHNVLIDPDVRGNISFYLKNLSVQSALDLIAKTTGYGYEIVDNTLIIASNEKLKREFAHTDFVFIVLENVKVGSATQLLRIIYPDLNTYADAEHNVIVISGLATDVTAAKQIIERYDVIGKGIDQDLSKDLLLTSSNESLVTKSMKIEFGDGEQIETYLQRGWPQREFTWEPHLRLLSGTTTLEEWEQIQEVVSARDYPNFILKGIIQSGDRVQVLVEYNSSTTLVELNNTLNGWTLIDVSGKSAQFSYGDRNFIIEMGR